MFTLPSNEKFSTARVEIYYIKFVFVFIIFTLQLLITYKKLSNVTEQHNVTNLMKRVV